MNKTVAHKLNKKALEIAEKFSNPDREYNRSKETFEFSAVKILSETSAVAYFKKSSGKIAITAMFYIKDPENGYWMYFFPKDSHILGMRKLPDILAAVEQHNFKFNFKDPNK